MERKRYLELCQKYAVGQDVTVSYDGSEYYPLRYELGFNGAGELVHVAIMKDKKANSIIHCGLEGVEIVEE